MDIRMTAVGMVQANCYLLSSEEKNVAIIDPGGNTERLIRYLKRDGLTPKMILLTHGHFDHLAALWELLDHYDVPVYIPQEDAEMIDDINLSLCEMVALYFPYREGTKYHTLQDGDVVTLDELSIKFIHTPGHSKGSGCYQVEDALFTGDTLFEGGIGRTDLYGADYAELKKSLELLAKMDGSLNVYPGHGKASTLAKECATNPHMGQVSYDDYF